MRGFQGDFNSYGHGPAGEGQRWTIALADLEQAVRAAEPAARMVPPRLLRRVIREHTSLGGFGLRVPHAKCYVIPREPLLEIADRDELGYGPEDLLPETVILIERPSADELAEQPAEELLTRCWRLLFHARIHLALEQCQAAGKLSTADVRRRIFQLGTVAFEEIRNVLRQEHLLLPPGDDTTVYIEFAALYLELRHFAPELLPVYFPAIESAEAVCAALAADVDAGELLRDTRPPGAPEPKAHTPSDLAEQDHEDLTALETMPDQPGPHAVAAHGAEQKVSHLRMHQHRSAWKYRSWCRRAERAAATGNVAGAAIRRANAEYWAPREQSVLARNALRNDIQRLVGRLQAALEIPEDDLRAWREALLDLVHQTPRGIWTVEARMLYDLQKVCADHERGVYTVDVMEWLLSRFRRPIKRPLPSQREVTMSKHLRSATRRLAAVRISARHRRQLSGLLRAAAERAEGQLRDHFRPKVTNALEDVDLRPRNLPERVARKKIVEELLDQIVDRGYLRLGDLRDALSRNNLKLPDGTGLPGLLHRDALLRVDRRLALYLDGVYERGEFYLRWMQRFSSLAFGTRTGRFLTRYFAVPFGGAFLLLAGIDEIAELITGHNPKLAGMEEIPRLLTKGIADLSVLNVPLLGLFILGLLYWQEFRQAAWRVSKAAGRTLRLMFVDSVRWLVRLPWVQWVFRSRLARYTYRFVVKPLIPTIIVWQLLHPEVSGWETTSLSAAFFLSLNLAINSRLGRRMEEALSDWIVEGWHRFGMRILWGLFSFVLDVFRRLLRLIERLLYAVDEWLRFKAGESSVSLWLKGILGVFWFYASYITRFGVNLLLEPQINPIKHFPVVTVSHKLLLPMIPHFGGVLMQATGMEKALAMTIAGAVITCIPGIFGFLVWELKENWRLYAANRSPTLRPVQVGSHGETMARLLRPGFHSGTVPKRFAKLRRAEQKAGLDGSKAARKHREALGHVESAVRRWLDREFVTLLAESPDWRAPPPKIANIRLACNRIQAAILLPGGEENQESADLPLRLMFDMEGGWMLADLSGTECAKRLSAEARQSLRTALVGLYKTGGVELLRRQIEAAFSLPAPPYGLIHQGLMVWPDGPMDVEILYDLRDGQPLLPQVLHGLPRRPLPTLPREAVIFQEMPVTWRQWVAAWEEASDGRGGNRDPWEQVPAV
jgi:hypothetical protein